MVIYYYRYYDIPTRERFRGRARCLCSMARGISSSFPFCTIITRTVQTRAWGPVPTLLSGPRGGSPP